MFRVVGAHGYELAAIENGNDAEDFSWCGIWKFANLVLLACKNFFLHMISSVSFSVDTNSIQQKTLTCRKQKTRKKKSRPKAA